MQENIDAIKIENDMDSLTEEDPIGIETKEVYVPSAFCVREAEPEVSLFCGVILGWNVCVSVFLQVIYNTIFSAENACNGFNLCEQDICTA